MFAFVISLIFGAAQVLLTEQLVYAFNDKNSKKTLMFLGIKFLAYLIAIGLVMLEFVWYISMIVCGFAVGVPVAAVGLFVYNTIYKK